VVTTLRTSVKNSVRELIDYTTYVMQQDYVVGLSLRYVPEEQLCAGTGLYLILVMVWLVEVVQMKGQIPSLHIA